MLAVGLMPVHLRVLGRYIKNKELECEDLATRLRDTRLKLEAEQARATEEQSVVSSARNSLAVAEVELEVHFFHKAAGTMNVEPGELVHE